MTLLAVYRGYDLGLAIRSQLIAQSHFMGGRLNHEEGVDRATDSKLSDKILRGLIKSD